MPNIPQPVYKWMTAIEEDPFAITPASDYFNERQHEDPRYLRFSQLIRDRMPEVPGLNFDPLTRYKSAYLMCFLDVAECTPTGYIAAFLKHGMSDIYLVESIIVSMRIPKHSFQIRTNEYVKAGVKHAFAQSLYDVNNRATGYFLIVHDEFGKKISEEARLVGDAQFQIHASKIDSHRAFWMDILEQTAIRLSLPLWGLELGHE